MIVEIWDCLDGIWGVSRKSVRVVPYQAITPFSFGWTPTRNPLWGRSMLLGGYIASGGDL